MILQNLSGRIDAALVRIIQSYDGRFPFAGKFLRAFREFAGKNSEQLRAEWERFHTSGDAHRLVDFLIDFARGNLPLGFPWSLFAGPFLEVLRAWLHEHENVLYEGIGSTV